MSIAEVELAPFELLVEHETPELTERQLMLRGLVHEFQTSESDNDRHDAFAQLYSATAADMFNVTYGMLGNKLDAEDATQDTFHRAFNALSRFRRESEVTTWLFRIAINASKDIMTKRKAPAREIGEVSDDEIAMQNEHHKIVDPEEAAINSIDHDELLIALQQLDLKYRNVVVLRAIYDLEHKDIAERLGIPEATSKTHYSRGLKRLNKILS